jgi:hypothetical protein
MNDNGNIYIVGINRSRKLTYMEEENKELHERIEELEALLAKKNVNKSKNIKLIKAKKNAQK